jgi:hypothetical protein
MKRLRACVAAALRLLASLALAPLVARQLFLYFGTPVPREGA